MRLAEVVTGMKARCCFVAIVWAVCCAVALDGRAAAAPRKRRAQPPRPPRPVYHVPEATRLMVIAPHPDDEMLGTGGLMQRVLETGGVVRVVYLTNGDGYPEGVRAEDHVESPSASDYRGYGRQRRREARAALAALGYGPSRYSYTFLNFPDGGLCLLTRSYWSERRAAFRSPYTRLDRPPKADVIVPDTEYRGEDLSQEIARTIGDFGPTLILVPRKEDQHADHCASWFFFADAITEVRRVHPDYSVDVLNYIIHFNSWPFEDEEQQLAPPPALRGGSSGWLRFPLTPAELKTKRAALARYKTQMHVMDWFLDGFARTNEVFSRPVPFKVMLPSRRNLCCDQ
jgi:LmbE family N-acetylglucosaminyl deacetylase